MHVTFCAPVSAACIYYVYAYIYTCIIIRVYIHSYLQRCIILFVYVCKYIIIILYLNQTRIYVGICVQIYRTFIMY